MPERRKPDEPVPTADGEQIKRVFDVYAGQVEAQHREVLRQLGRVLAEALKGSPPSRTSDRATGHSASESASIECRADGRRTPSRR